MSVAEMYNKHPKTVRENASIKEVIQELLADDINGAIVLNAKDKVVGIISIQDITAATVPQEMQENNSLANAMFKPGLFEEMSQEIAATPVRELMRKEFIRATSETSILEIATSFSNNDLYIVPVIENDKLLGVITRSEIKRAIAKEMGVLSA